MSWKGLKEKNHSFVPFPRWIADLYREKKISQSAFFVYVWIRINSDIYGKTRTSFVDLTYDLFRLKIKKNTVDKAVLELRKKKLIYYEKMQGKRVGTFVIHNDEILLRGGRRTSIEHLFIKEESVSSQKSTTPIQKSEEPYNLMNKNNMRGDENDKFRSIYNENEIENKKENETIDSISRSIAPEENNLCYEIGYELGEKNMAFVQMLLGKYGKEAIKSAYERYKNDKSNNKIFEVPRKHFRNLVDQVGKI